MSSIKRNQHWIVIPAFLLSLARPVPAIDLKPETVRAWDQYLRWADQKAQHIISDPNIFLIQNTLPLQERMAIQQQLESGRIVAHRVENVVPQGIHFEVPAGEIHHWWGAILLRNASLPQLLQFLQDYDHHAGKFSDVERSRLISVSGNHYRFFLRLKRSQSFVTAYYNTEQECDYILIGSKRASSQSTATKIAELDNPGTDSEHEKPPGNDRGFMWRLVSWWRFEQKGPDVLVELESASLSRNIPAIIKYMPGISSYIRSIPRETMELVLVSIRKHMGH